MKTEFCKDLPRVHGAYPRRLLKFFSKRKYLDLFLKKGILRLGSLDSYRKIEDPARVDPCEGVGFYRKPGKVFSALVSTDPTKSLEVRQQRGLVKTTCLSVGATYVFCCANRNANLPLLKEKFGPYVAEICSPVGLALAIEKSVNCSGEKHEARFSVIGIDVEYTRGDVLKKDDPRTDVELSFLSFSQKDRRFADEEEFRYCVKPFHPCNDDQGHIEVDLRGPNTFSKRLSD